MKTQVVFLRERIHNLAQLQAMINTALENIAAQRCDVVDIKLTSYGNDTVLAMLIYRCELENEADAGQ